jgi:hypothetical protein
MAQFRKCLRLNLANAFAGHAEFLCHLLERMFPGAADAESHAHDALFARGEVVKRLSYRSP